MRRRRSIVAAALAALTMVGVTGARAATTPKAEAPGPRVESSLAATLAKSKPGDVMGAFVNVVHGASPASVLAAHGLQLTQDFSEVDAAFAVGTVAHFRGLKADPTVAYVEPNKTYKLFDNSRYATRVEALQSPIYGGRYRDANNQILTGKGIGVAEIDSGIDGTHPDLKSHIVKNFKVVCATPVLVNSSGDKADQCYQVTFQETQDSDTSSGHGTHVAGIVAGDGSASGGMFKGVAPEASLYGFGTGEADSIITQQAVSSFQWVIDNWDKVTPNIRVITNSWGCIGGCAFDPASLVTKLVDKAVAKGITVLFAAGNDGCDSSCSTLYHDGSVDKTSGDSKNPTPGVISVANYDDLTFGARDNVLDASSSRGLASDASTWPDVSAPGSLITSTCNHATPICNTGPVPAWSPYYALLSGTSMATPHVAGIVALLLQENPSLTPAQIESLIQRTAHKIPVSAANPGQYVDDPQNPGSTSSFDKGAGLADVQAAVDALGGDHANSFTISPMSVAIDSPAAGAQVTGPTTFTGTADTTEQTRSVIAGDLGDYNGPGGADISGLTVKDEPTGVRYSIGLRNVSDTGSGNTTVTLRINQNVNGAEAWTNVLLSPGGTASASAFNASTNQAPATDVHVDRVANTVDFLVPYSEYADGAGHSVGHNTVVTTLIGTLADVAPGGLGATYVSNPEQAAPYGFHYSSSGEAPVVTLTVNGGPDLPTTVTGSGTQWSWSGNIDFSTYPAGTYQVRAKLYLGGIHRQNTITTVVVPERPDVSAPDAPVITSPVAGSLNPARPTFAGSAEAGSTVKVLEGASVVASTTAGPSGAWSVSAPMTDGVHTVTATATDAAGNTSVASAAVGFDVDALAPTVTVASPTANQVFLPSDDLLVSGTAGDSRSVNRITIRYVNAAGQLAASQTATCSGCGTSSASWSATAPSSLLPGTYKVQVTAYDDAGNASGVTVKVVRL